MRKGIRVIIFFVALWFCFILWLSIWPGLLVDLLFFTITFSVLWVPLVLPAAVVFAVMIAARIDRAWLTPLPKLEISVLTIIGVLTLGMLKYEIPRRLAFVVSRDAFEQYLVAAKPSKFGGVPIHSRVGLYRVSEYAADPRGGVFFCVYSGADGIGPDVMSHGFAYQPNCQGTPFGAARYHVYHIIGDWYGFRASDDWF